MNTFFDLTRKDYDDVFAGAHKAGVYEDLPRCPQCKMAACKQAGPFTIEWEYGSNLIGDFTWPGVLEDIVVSDRVKTCFQANGFSGATFELVEMVQKKGLKKPRKESKARTRVWLPYEGPPLWHLLVESWCSMDVELSRRSLTTVCDACKRWEMTVHQRDAPLVVRPETWLGTDIFRMRELRGLVLVSERVKQEIETHGFTNVKMSERGQV
jgi:hypothetical protein